jgi:hypothetical protein
MTKPTDSHRSTPPFSKVALPLPEILVGLVTPATLGVALGSVLFHRAVQQVSQVSESWFQGERLPSLFGDRPPSDRWVDDREANPEEK